MESVESHIRTTVIEDGASVLPLGTCLERRFVLEKVLGRGGTGVVYKALDMIAEARHARQPYVALKLLIPELAADERFKRLLFDEVEKARCLAHPNIINVREYFEDGANVFLTMEYLEGKTLEQLLEEHPGGLPPAQAWPIIQSMGEALACAHANGIVHADIKPANVFVMADDSARHGKAKVVDFGISKRASLAARGVDVAPATATTILGGMRAYTPLYASPEQLEGGEPGYADDVYALACTIYQIYTGTHPFKGIPANQARSAGVKPLRPRGLDGRQWNTLLRGLSFSARERTPSVNELIHGLQPRGSAQRRRVWTILAGAGVLLAVLGLWVTAYKGEPGDADACAASDPSCPQTGLRTAAPAAGVRPIPLAELEPGSGKTAVSTPLRWNDGGFPRLDDEVIFSLGKHRAVSVRGDLAVGVDNPKVRIGESFSMRFASARFTYVYALVLDPGNHAEQIYPNAYQPDRPVEPDMAYEIPPPGATDFSLEIGEPAGRHRLIVAASQAPLSDFAARFGLTLRPEGDSETLSVTELSVDVVR